jgi:hypothetical protein
VTAFDPAEPDMEFEAVVVELDHQTGRALLDVAWDGVERGGAVIPVRNSGLRLVNNVSREPQSLRPRLHLESLRSA